MSLNPIKILTAKAQRIQQEHEAKAVIIDRTDAEPRPIRYNYPDARDLDEKLRLLDKAAKDAQKRMKKERKRVKRSLWWKVERELYDYEKHVDDCVRKVNTRLDSKHGRRFT